MAAMTELKHEANRLRKEQRFEAALPLYRELWEHTDDEYVGTGLLCCLRKLRLFDDAVALADELIPRYPDFEWCRREVAWTWIHGIMDREPENKPFERILEAADRVMGLNPDEMTKKAVIRRVLKMGSSLKRWKTVNEWAIKIDPDSLDTEPLIVDDSGRKGWSEQATWYNYRIKGLINEGDSKGIEEAIVLANVACEQFPRQRKYFERLKASAKHSLGDLDEAEQLYRSLCEGDRPEWWLVHGYARVVRDQNRKDDALKLMYRAATTCRTLKSMVALLRDIGRLCLEMEKWEEARCHFLLCKHVREAEGWSVPEELSDSIASTSHVMDAGDEPVSLEHALRLCRSHWDRVLGVGEDGQRIRPGDRKTRLGLTGKVLMGPGGKAFCFIAVEGEQPIYCHKSELPPNVENGGMVEFNARPSFDKKKNQESWKAYGVREHLHVVGGVRAEG